MFSIISVLLLSPMITGNIISTSKCDSEWWQHMVLYQIYPRSFMDSNGDGIGDLNGITTKLPYIASTGITAVWLSPIFDSPMVDFGYDIRNFTKIQSEYGNIEDLKRLISEAKRLGITVLLDFVPNHTSDQSEWFIKSVNRVAGFEDYYIWHDGKIDGDGKRGPPNNWISAFRGSAWTWNEKRQQYFFHQFAKEQPDLNYRNPKVVAEINEVILYLLNLGIGGFRVDAVVHLFEDPNLQDEPKSGRTNDTEDFDYLDHIYTKDLLESVRQIQDWRTLLEEYSNKHGGLCRILVTEAYANITSVMEYYETDDGCKGSNFPFNFFLLTDLKPKSDARDIVYLLQKWMAYMPFDGTANWVLGNHDNPRIATRFNEKRLDGLNFITMLSPGVAVTYNGDEIGMQDHPHIPYNETKDPAGLNAGPDKFQKYSRDPERTPFQWDSTENSGFSKALTTWLPVNPNYKQLNLANQIKAPRSHYKVYRDLIEFRNQTTFKNGSFHPKAYNRCVIIFTRMLKGHTTFIVVVNICPTEQMVNLKILTDVPEKLVVAITGSESSYTKGTIVKSEIFPLGPFDAAALRGLPSLYEERREVIKIIIKSANIILVGLLIYKLWDNKWAKLNFNKAAKTTF